jgi:UDP-GlcNAc:undecaprenyl-phosphate GlcNAc-1-phosphate transferase
MGIVGRLAAAGLAAAGARAAYAWLSAPESPQAEPLVRTNHRGEPVTLAQGHGAVMGSLAAIAVVPGLPGRVRAAGVLATGAAGALGAYDDLFGATGTKGFRGHLTALRAGEVTSGTVKLAGIGVTGLVSGALVRGGRGGMVDVLLAGVVVAGAANLLNLFDLRPGRASKVFLAAAAPGLVTDGAAGTLLAGPTGAVLALLPEDLGERSMLGDAGANALGAAWGTAAAASLSRTGLAATAAGLVALTVASERVSFSEVIERQSLLRAVDAFGRRSPT